MLLGGLRKASSPDPKGRPFNSTANVPSKLRDSGLDASPGTSRELSRPGSVAASQVSSFQSPNGLLPASHGSDKPASPNIRSASPSRRRFSMLKFRHASDPQLSTRFKEDGLHDPAAPGKDVGLTPSIVTTAPTINTIVPSQAKRKRRPKLFGLGSRSRSPASEQLQSPHSGTPSGVNTPAHVSFEDRSRLSAHSLRNAPSPYGEATGSSSGLRCSESTPSEGSSAGPFAFATTTTTHTVSTTTTFFRFPHKKKKPEPLFPLPVKLTPPASQHSDSPPSTAIRRPSYQRTSPSATVPPSTTSLFRQDSTNSARSAISSPGMPPFAWHSLRSRSSTMNSGSDPAASHRLALSESGRNSTASTLGRNSTPTLKGLNQKARQSSGPYSPRRSSPGNTLVGTPATSSQHNSFTLSREALVIPDRIEGETAGKYLERLREAIPQKNIASVLSKSADTFSHDVLRSFLRTFSFFEEPLDMSVRKLLWSIRLPSEAQQIDRVIHALAERYHECNPGIFKSPDTAYFAAYSLIILNSDLFNKNNKHKMQREEYQKNTSGEDIPQEVLGYFYDNIQYTEFIQKLDEEDVDSNRSKSRQRKSKKLRTKNLTVDEPGKLDPYDLILEGRLHILRPQLKDVMTLEDPYDYQGTQNRWDMRRLQGAFARSGILQLMSYRSRPEAFMTASTTTNPEEASPGVVDINITKVGLLWRKGPKKHKTRSPWQEWGALLTSNQLFLVKNASWVKSLVQQYDTHQKQGNGSVAVVFKPALKEFKPETSLPLQNAVALRDSSYKKHKNAFVFARSGGYEEIFLADNESEMNDWLAKMNYAATFKSCNIAMRTFQAIPKATNKISDRAKRGINASPISKSAEFEAISKKESIEDVSEAQKILTARRQAILNCIAKCEEELGLRSEELEENLRTARHLQVLAPILPKTREFVVLAAGRMAAKLKWLRFEVWRLRCHKDLLSRDLEDEKIALTSVKSINSITHPTSPATLRKSDSVGHISPSATNSNPAQSPILGTQHRMSIASIDNSELDETPGEPETYILPVADSLPLMVVSSDSTTNDIVDDAQTGSHGDGLPRHNPSISSAHSHDVASGENSQLVTPAASIKGSEDIPIPRRQSGAAESDKEPRSIISSPGSRSKPLKSLQRTLRDSREFRGQHHRSRKGKESSSSAVIDDASSAHGSEVLARGRGSFTVHGKKASVITFGSEWQNMSAEERLQLRRQAQNDDQKLVEPTAVGDQSEDNEAVTSEDEGSYRGPRFSGLNGASFHVGDDGAIMFYDPPSPPEPTADSRRSSISGKMRRSVDSDYAPIGEVATYKNHEMAEENDEDSSPENIDR